MVKETINFNSTPDGIACLEKLVERLESENAELVCEVGARREREERVWDLVGRWQRTVETMDGVESCAVELQQLRQRIRELRASLEG